MKKLMIAAAAAAMISGAYANTVFDFTAKVTTTKSKLGGNLNKVDIAHDGAFNWWYNEGALFTPNALDPTFLDYTASSGAVVEKAVKVDKTGVGKIQLGKFNTNELKADLATDLTVNYGPYDQPDIYKGAKKFCFSVSYKSDVCIRVKGSETIKTWFDDLGAGCCAATVTPAAPLALFEAEWDSKLKTYVVGPWLVGDMMIATLYRFGSDVGTKCSNIEAVGWIGDAGVGDDGTGKATYKTIPNFAFAGQGTWGKNTASDRTFENNAIQKISGNIVGIWYEPECEICCGADRSSLAFSCDLTQDSITAPAYMGLNDAAFAGGAPEWGTAAFGTFTLTFNRSLSSGLPNL